jgi:hypothetical protein
MDHPKQDDVSEAEETAPVEMPIDLNALFAEGGRDLNRLFPDGRFRVFLRDVRRSQRAVERLLERLESEE